MDRRLVELREDVRVDHLVDRAEHGGAIDDIEDEIDRIEQRIDLMRAKQHRRMATRGDALDRLDDTTLVARIEADQRLVEQQQRRIAQQRLREQNPLPLTAGEAVDRTRREVGRADFGERRARHAPLRPRSERPAPLAAAERAQHEIETGQAELRGAAPELRHVADARMAAPRRRAEHADLPAARGHETEDRAKQRRLAGSVGPEHPDEGAVGDRKRRA